MSSLNTPWRPRIDIIKDGEPVSADVNNRPISQLADQARSLKGSLDSLAAGSGRLVFSRAPLDASVNLFDFVYFDPESNTFRPALAEAVVRADGQCVAGARAMVAGMVISMQDSTGDILQVGRLNLADLEVSPALLLDTSTGEGFVPGRYFLSDRVPGKITRFLKEPNIQLGMFTASECLINPIQNDLSDSRSQYNFPLTARPAASQNFNRTGFHTFGSAIGPKRVDYFYKAGMAPGDNPPDILLCVRNNGQAPVDSTSPFRVELSKDVSGKLLVQGYSAGITYEDSVSGVLNSFYTLDWPDYGQWVTHAGTNLDFAFIRRDGVYAEGSTLAGDIATMMTDGAWKIFLPNDLVGWANANPLDLATPQGVLYRYISESDTALNNAFPPIPAESAAIYQNGTLLESNVDFIVNPFGVYWLCGGISPNGMEYSPWPKDYITNGGEMSSDNARSLWLAFSRSSLANLRSVVFSLIGIPPIVVKECPSGDSASAGNLQISIDLGLLISPADPVTADTAIVGVTGTTFTLGDVVSELVTGPGLTVTRLSTKRNKNVGKLQLSLTGLKFEGEFPSIALRNAKEVWAGSALSYIEFLPPANSPTGITACFKIPNEDFDPSTIKLAVRANVLGSDSNNTNIDQLALFRVIFHVIRPGFSLNDLTQAKAVCVQYWTVPFYAASAVNARYLANTVLSQEVPIPADPANDEFIITPASIGQTSNIISTGFLAGDTVSVQIDRIKTIPSSNMNDTYTGRVGLTNLRWSLH